MQYAVIGAAIVIAVLWWIYVSNKFKTLMVKVDETISGIDVALTKRYDTLVKMLDTTKAYAKHEADTFDHIVKLRKDMTVSEKNNLSAQLDQVQSKISLIAENYPELRSSENFKQLQIAIADVEEHLQASRRLHNANVSLFNQMLVTFPDSIVGNSMHLSKKDFFVAEESKKKDVAMQFDSVKG